MTNTRKTTNTYAWLMTRTRGGDRRIQRLDWTRLADIYRKTRSGPTRQAIRREAERCGYDPHMILHLH